MMFLRRTLILSAALVCSGCAGVETLSIDCLHPGEVSFPTELRRVAIVNNTIETPGPRTDLEPTDMPEAKRGERAAYYNGYARLCAEALSEAIARENYFDEVVICDSALRARDTLFRPTELTRGEVARLAWQLDTDVLIAIEALPLRTTERVEFDPFEDLYRGTLDVKLFPVVRVYISGRQGPMATLVATDSIYFETYGLSSWEAREALYADGEAMTDASRYAGESIVRRLLPYWQTTERQLFIGGNSQMRDAAVHAHREQWTEAIDIWQRLYNEKPRRGNRLRTAHNIALAYEMCDSIAEALTWAQRAQAVATELYGPPQTTDAMAHPYSLLIDNYCRELSRRRSEAAILRAQMKRTEDDN